MTHRTLPTIAKEEPPLPVVEGEPLWPGKECGISEGLFYQLSCITPAMHEWIAKLKAQGLI